MEQQQKTSIEAVKGIEVVDFSDWFNLKGYDHLKAFYDLLEERSKRVYWFKFNKEVENYFCNFLENFKEYLEYFKKNANDNNDYFDDFIYQNLDYYIAFLDDFETMELLRCNWYALKDYEQAYGCGAKDFKQLAFFILENDFNILIDGIINNSEGITSRAQKR